jgi:hypothetical protein
MKYDKLCKLYELHLVNGRTPAYHYGATEHKELKIHFFSLQNPIRIHPGCNKEYRPNG